MAIKDLTRIRKHLFLCNGGSCKIRGAEESTIAIRGAISAAGLDNEIHTTKTLCNGRCNDGPIVISQPDGTWFKNMIKDKAPEFVQQFIIDGLTPQEEVLYVYGQDHINGMEIGSGL